MPDVDAAPLKPHRGVPRGSQAGQALEGGRRASQGRCAAPWGGGVSRSRWGHECSFQSMCGGLPGARCICGGREALALQLLPATLLEAQVQNHDPGWSGAGISDTNFSVITGSGPDPWLRALCRQLGGCCWGATGLILAWGCPSVTLAASSAGPGSGARGLLQLLPRWACGAGPSFPTPCLHRTLCEGHVVLSAAVAVWRP